MQKPFWRGKELKVAKNFSKMSIFLWMWGVYLHHTY